jgi:hypothetical protein
LARAPASPSCSPRTPCGSRPGGYATKRLIEIEDVAVVVVLLASEAGAGITCSTISIDAGTPPY